MDATDSRGQTNCEWSGCPKCSDREITSGILGLQARPRCSCFIVCVYCTHTHTHKYTYAFFSIVSLFSFSCEKCTLRVACRFSFITRNSLTDSISLRFVDIFCNRNFCVHLWHHRGKIYARELKRFIVPSASKTMCTGSKYCSWLETNRNNDDDSVQKWEYYLLLSRYRNVLYRPFTDPASSYRHSCSHSLHCCMHKKPVMKWHTQLALLMAILMSFNLQYFFGENFVWFLCDFFVFCVYSRRCRCSYHWA